MSGNSSSITPGGSTTEVQYNNLSTFNGTPYLTIASDEYPVVGDYIGIAPVAPTSGTKIYTEYKAGRRMLAQQGVGNQEYAFQPALFANKVGWWTAQGNSTTVTAINFSNSITGTATIRNVTSDTLFNSMRRLGYSTGNGPGGSAGNRHNVLQFFISANPTFGGFFYTARFGISTNSTLATQRSFVGLIALTTALPNADPSTNINMIGFGVDAADTTWYFMHNDVSGIATKDALVGTFAPRDLGVTMFEIRIYSPPGTAIIYYSIEALGGGSFYEGNTSTDIPAVGTLLAPQIWTNNSAVGAAAAIDIVSQYIETDY